MRMLLLCAALLFPSLVVGQAITQQGYTGGNATVGGCTGLIAADVKTLSVGQCYPGNDGNSSIWINDCWSNGVVSVTSYNGSTSCNTSFVSGLSIAAANVVGTSVNQSFCNVDAGAVPPTYDTLTCATVTPTPLWSITVNIFPTVAPFNSKDCTGTPPLGQNVTAGTCTKLTGTGVGANNPSLYVIANCANGLVTSVIFLNDGCSVQFNSTGQISATSVLGPLGPFSQVNAPSATGKPIGQAGSSCASNPNAYLSFTCVATTPAPTTLPPTGSPTTPSPTAPPKNSTATALTAGIAVAMLPILTTIF